MARSSTPIEEFPHHYPCSLCDVVLSKLSILDDHVELMHNSELNIARRQLIVIDKDYACTKCVGVFPSYNTLAAHYYEHIMRRDYAVV